MNIKESPLRLIARIATGDVICTIAVAHELSNVKLSTYRFLGLRVYLDDGGLQFVVLPAQKGNLRAKKEYGMSLCHGMCALRDIYNIYNFCTPQDIIEAIMYRNRNRSCRISCLAYRKNEDPKDACN